MVKISRPTPKDAFLRHRLFDHLDQMRRFPVIWISAPAGSGKTTLVSSYIENRNIPCLWYQVDKGDTDVATFFYYMREAAKNASPRKRISLPLLTPEYLQGFSTFALRYFEHLYNRLKTPSILVFDNYHEAPLDSPLHEVMSSAFSLLPEGNNVVVISRNDPPATVARLRANRSLTLVRWEDIRLTDEEARGMFANRGDKSYPEETMLRLYELSDGWAAGLVLLSEAAKGESGKPAFAEQQTFDEVFDYFATEVFRHLDARTREFFLTTAFLPKMTVQMAEQLTNNPAAGKILRTMCRNNYFVVRHSDPGRAFEYHPLYRDFLLSRARSDLPAEMLTMVRRTASALLEEAGMTEAAIPLLQEIGDWEAMVDVIIAHAQDMLMQGRHRPLQAWLESLPAEVLSDNPWLLYWRGMSTLPFSPSHAGTNFQRAFAGFQAAGDDLGAMLAASGVINSIAYSFDDFVPLDHWYAVLNDLAVRTGAFPNEEIEASVIAGLITASKLREITSFESEIWDQRAMKIPETHATITTKVQAIHCVFWHRLLNSGPLDALPLLHELRRLSRLPEAPPMIHITAQAAEVQYHFSSGLHDELIAAAQKGLDISKKTGVHIEDMWFVIHTASSFVSRMDYKGAKTWFDRIPPMAEGWPNWAKAIYHLQLMRMALIRKEHNQALIEAKLSLDYGIRTGSPVAMATTQLMLATLLPNMGRREEAVTCLEQGRFYALQKNSISCMIFVLMIDAQFAFDEGNDTLGFHLLRKSLALTRECGYVLSFFDNPVLTLWMCEKALEAGIEVEHVQEIIRRRGLVPEKSPVHSENWPWPLKIYTLGRFSIVRDGKPLPFSGRVKQAPLRMLKVLIALGGREISESSISCFLWPESEGDMAQQAFETNLHRLRKLLGLPEAIRVSDGKVTLDNRYCWVDIWAFERLSRQADESKKQNRADHSCVLTKKAIDLYPGAFLAEEHEEPWLVSTSARLRNKLLRNIVWLGSHLEGQYAWENAATFYERCLEIDDLTEEIYRRLITCYKQTGKNTEALATYQRCRKTLSAVLGISPSPETENLLSSIFFNKLHKKFIL
jgi:DNA-binding SARP family transcriptional activator